MSQQAIRVGDTLTNILDTKTGESVTYNKVTLWSDGTSMTDFKCDGVIYRKLGAEYFKRNYESLVDIRWFGANGGGVVDDTAAIQKALDTIYVGDTLVFQALNYKTTAKLTFNKYSVNIKGNKANIVYYGSSLVAFDISTVVIGANTIFSLSNVISDISVDLTNAPVGCTAWSISSSTSRISNLSGLLKKNDQVGFEIKGDKLGTGSYYNMFENLRVQGNQPTTTGQVGIKFTYDPTTPSRCPNANTFIGGRVGQCDIAWVINGNGNTIIHPTIEGTRTTGFSFTNPDSTVGCVNNNIYGGYVEGVSGLNVYVFGTNATGCAVRDPYITSIGAGVIFTDNSTGKTNVWTSPSNTKMSANGFVLAQPTAITQPTISAAGTPGLKLADTLSNTTVNMRNAGNTSTLNRLIDFVEMVSSVTLFQFGTAQAIFKADDVLFGGDTNFGVKSGLVATRVTPEGSVIGKPGSIYFSNGGAIGATAFLKESGVSTAGWRAMATITSGTTAARPVVTVVGFQYFDTTLGKPIWWNGTVWKDATGTTV